MPSAVREKIIKNAIELFLQFGVNNVRVSEILRAADCSKSAFYKEFPSKEGLLEICLAHYNRHWFAIVFDQPIHNSFDDEGKAQERSLGSFRESAEKSLDKFRGLVENGSYKGSLILSVLFQAKGEEKFRQIALNSQNEVLAAIIKVLKGTSLITAERLAAMMLLLLQGTAVSILRGRENTFDATVLAQRILLAESFADVQLNAMKGNHHLILESTRNRTEMGFDTPRARLIAAADKLFGRYGSSQVGLNELLAEANVARATLYEHFGSKDALVKDYLARLGKEKFQLFDWLIEQRSLTVEYRLELLFRLLKEHCCREDCYGPIYLTELFQLPENCEIRQICEFGVSGYREKLSELISQENIEHTFGEIAFLYLQGAMVSVVLGQPSSFDLAASAVIGTLRELRQRK